jgi:hypothetical protein
MKDIIRHILKEEFNKKRMARLILDQLNLSPWINKRYQMQFLATPGKTVIILYTKTDDEISVQDGIYIQLKRIIKDDQDLENFVKEYVIEKGFTLDHESWVNSSDNVGMVEDDDEPMDININNN